MTFWGGATLSLGRASGLTGCEADGDGCGDVFEFAELPVLLALLLFSDLRNDFMMHRDGCFLRVCRASGLQRYGVEQ